MLRDIKLVAIDLDGTLLDNDYVISTRAKQAIKRVRSEGVEVTLCTGRMYRSALPYAQELGLALPLITYQGAMVKNSGTGEVLYERFVPAVWAREVIKLGKDWGFPVNLYYEDDLYVEEATPMGRLYASRVGVKMHEVGDLLEFVSDGPIKLLAIEKNEARLEGFEQVCREKFADNLYITRSMPEYLEFLHPEATKGRGLSAVAMSEGISAAQVMAIGDSYNDLEMFAYAGFSVAMGNARPEIKEKADYITTANEDDGVAEALNKFC